MCKLLVTILALPTISFASNLDISNLKCKNLQITPTTTLKQVQDNCLIKSQKSYDWMYEVKFINDTTGKSVICDFVKNDPSEFVNGCR